MFNDGKGKNMPAQCKKTAVQSYLAESLAYLQEICQ